MASFAGHILCRNYIHPRKLAYAPPTYLSCRVFLQICQKSCNKIKQLQETFYCCTYFIIFYMCGWLYIQYRWVDEVNESRRVCCLGSGQEETRTGGERARTTRRGKTEGITRQLLHFTWVVDDVKCVPLVTRVCLCVCVRGRMPILLHWLRCNLGEW